MQSIKARKKGLYAVSALFFVLTFCIKPALIGLPAILTAYLWGRYRRKDWLFYVKYSGLFWLLSLIYYIVFKCVAPAGNLLGGKNFSDQLILMGWRFGSYFVKTFVPYGLNPYYPHFSLVNDSLLPLYAVGIIALLLLEFLRRGNKKALYLYLPLFISFSAAVAPGLLKIGDVDFADRYSYFPSIFAVLAAGSGLCALINKFPRSRKAVIAGVCCLTLGMGIRCFDEVFVWENEKSYTRATLDHPLPNYRCLIGETIVNFDQGDHAAVQKNIRRLREDYMDIPANRKQTIDFFVESLEGVILVRQGHTKAGMKKLTAVLSHPNWGLLTNTSYGYPRMVLLTVAGVCQRAGNKKDAAEMYRRLANLYGTYEPMEKEFYLALSALCLGDKKTALEHFEKAQQLNPQDENIRKNIEILRKHVR
jgi:tetratricopeptide (TPR) repeat protein